MEANNNERNARREAMLEKVRKLLAMARDGRGNKNEEEVAMRQANKIMTQYGIDEAECDMREIEGGKMEFGEAKCGYDGRAPEKGSVYRTMPVWAGVLAVGVARFTDSVVIRRSNEFGELLAFQGERGDVLFARWMFGVLGRTLIEEKNASGWTRKKEATDFLLSAASMLQHRLKTLAQERHNAYREAQQTSNSRALVVVEKKGELIRRHFGEQRVSRTRRAASSSASLAGAEAGRRINIPTGRPVGHTARAQLAA